MKSAMAGAFSLIILICTGGAWAAQVPDTGQVKCYNNTGEIPCPSPGQPFYGQDASYGINPMSYTKLDASGNALPVSATSWVMVKDNVTGLIWENKTDDGTIHDMDNKYTWYDPDNPIPGTPGDGTDTKDYLDALNREHFGGYSDWRLPHLNELASLVNHGIPQPGPKIDAGFFPNIKRIFYWSATTLQGVSQYAKGIYFDDGDDVGHLKSDSYNVLVVRGAAVLADGGSFSNNGDGTVTDSSTGLTWQKETAAGTMSWEEALSYCEDLNLGNQTDWRLPTIMELRSLLDYSLFNPAINTSYFTDIPKSVPFYWSSTSEAYDTYAAWGVTFYEGHDTYGTKTYRGYVRAVRGGQSTGHSVLSVSPANRNVAMEAGTATFSVANSGTGTMPWTAAVTSGDSWLRIASGASGSEAGTITFDYDASTSARTGTIQVTAAGATGSPIDVTVAQIQADLSSPFDASAENWRASTGTATLAWQASGGTPDGYLRGTGPAGTNAWFFISPESWAGDWSGYKVLKFDYSIPSRHYPDAGQAGMVVIVGTNGQQMTWTASTPLWTWTHYEMDLSPAAFGVDQATFDGIITSVAELRILAEFSVSTETVGLDNVLVTATPAEAHRTDLVSRFTDSTIEGWRPVDDVTLTATETGQPSFGLKADDWTDGRIYKVATPLTWAGDWRQFRQLSFDMHWTGNGVSHTDIEMVRIFGANGQTLSWSGPVTSAVWTHHAIPLTPETFGVSAAELEAVLAHVSEMWIFGEFGGGDDITMLDNIVLTTSTSGPPQLTRNLIARFDTDKEGWVGFDNSTLTWAVTNGISGGGLKSVDAGSGTARFQSPDAWSGDWRAFTTLRFMLRPQVSARTDYNTVIWITSWNGSKLGLTLPKPYGSWTPYTVDLTPETFGVTPGEFEAIMADVACLWINADLVDGAGVSDSTRLDNVMLLTENEAGLASDQRSDFETGNENWRYGGWKPTPADWSFSAGLAPHVATGGNPGGFLQNTDTGDWTYWFTPEGWAGDWRGLKSVSFDFNIIQGTSLWGDRMISLCSPWMSLHAVVARMPVPGQWMHYEFALTPETFGVSAETFEQVMRDVVMLGIRSEWITGPEVEGLDNYRQRVTLMGDINGDSKMDLTDAVLSLQVTSGMHTWVNMYSAADVNDDEKIGIEDAIYVMQMVSGLGTQ